jgi:uncharacterized OsmC-like protein
MTTIDTNVAREQQASPRRDPIPRNGVDTPLLFATINTVAEQPELAEFRFRAENRWLKGTHTRTSLGTFDGAGGEHRHAQEFAYDADHHPVLCGQGAAPAPIEFLLHALASCIAAGVANVAAARGVTLESVQARVEGDINLLGLLGLSKTVRNGFSGLRIHFEIKGDASPEKLRQIVEQARDRSAVFDSLNNGVPIDFNVEAA